MEEKARLPDDCTTELADSHAHLQLEPLFENIDEALAAASTAGVVMIVVNAVCPGGDWDRVELLCDSGHRKACLPQLVPSFGLHPWWIEKFTSSLDKDDVQDARGHLAGLIHDKLLANPMACVGECGLDKNIKKNVSLQTQEVLLRCQLQLAVKFQRTVSLHCVGAWGRLFDVLVALQNDYLSTCNEASTHRNGHSFCIVFHSCNRMSESMFMRFQSLHFKMFFSFNGKQIDEGMVKLLRVIPTDSLLIETDSPDQIILEDTQCTARNYNEPANISIACRRISSCLDNMSYNDVAAVTRSNAKKAFLA